MHVLGWIIRMILTVYVYQTRTTLRRDRRYEIPLFKQKNTKLRQRHSHARITQYLDLIMNGYARSPLSSNINYEKEILNLFAVPGCTS